MASLSREHRKLLENTVANARKASHHLQQQEPLLIVAQHSLQRVLDGRDGTELTWSGACRVFRQFVSYELRKLNESASPSRYPIPCLLI